MKEGYLQGPGTEMKSVALLFVVANVHSQFIYLLIAACVLLSQVKILMRK